VARSEVFQLYRRPKHSSEVILLSKCLLCNIIVNSRGMVGPANPPSRHEVIPGNCHKSDGNEVNEIRMKDA
jgi:hypothetical protein